MSDQAFTDDNSIEVVIVGPNEGKTMMCGDVYFTEGRARIPRNDAPKKMNILSRYYQVRYAHEVAAERAQKEPEAEQAEQEEETSSSNRRNPRAK